MGPQAHNLSEQHRAMRVMRTVQVFKRARETAPTYIFYTISIYMAAGTLSTDGVVHREVVITLCRLTSGTSRTPSHCLTPFPISKGIIFRGRKVSRPYNLEICHGR